MSNIIISGKRLQPEVKFNEIKTRSSKLQNVSSEHPYIFVEGKIACRKKPNVQTISYVINSCIQHHNIWKFYIQSKYIYSNLTNYINNSSSCPFIASDDCSKTRRVVKMNSFLTIAGVYFNVSLIAHRLVGRA